MKKANNFQIAKAQPQGRVLLSISLIFCRFQPDVAYKSLAYKKACNSLSIRCNVFEGCLKFLHIKLGVLIRHFLIMLFENTMHLFLS